MLPFLLDKYLRVKWLNHIVGECLTFRETVKLFSKWLYYFQFPPAMCESSSCSIPEISKLCPIDQIWPAICFFMAREPQLLSLRVWSLCSATRGHDSERPLLAATGESPRTEMKTQHSQK